MGTVIKTFEDGVTGAIAVDTSLWIHYAIIKNGGSAWLDAYDFFEQLLLSKDTSILIYDVVVSEFIHKMLQTKIKQDCKSKLKNGTIDELTEKRYLAKPKAYYVDYKDKWQGFMTDILDDDVEPLLTNILIQYISFDCINEKMFNKASIQIKNHDLDSNDAYIAAITRAIGCKQIATCDRDFKRVEGLTVYLPKNLA